MKKNYYEEKIESLKNMISLKQLNDAYIIVNEELNMPYIPEIYEKKFIDLLNEVKISLFGSDVPQSVSREVAIEYLISNDENQEAIALELLRDHNLRYDIDVIKRRIETWPPEKNMLKAYLFELLIEQEVDAEIIMNGISMNPKKTISILENKEVIKAMNQLSKSFEKNPASLNMALDEYQKFILITYPAVPENGVKFGHEFANVINSMFDDSIKLSEMELNIKSLLLKNNT